MATRQRRVGLFGGAFDPPHKAHVALAQAAVQQLELDELRVLPTGQPSHKGPAVSSAAHRLAMARLAFADVARAQVDPREIGREGPSYTYDTLMELQAEQPRARFFLVVGGDQFAAFRDWHRWRDILRNAVISVARRPDDLRDRVVFDAEIRAFGEPRLIELPAMAISASAIRRDLAAGIDIRPLVPASIASYIETHHLYPTPA